MHSKQPTPKTRWTLGVSSDLKVTHYDAEFADMDNPQGAMVAEVFHLCAVTERGDRRAWGSFPTYEAAQAAIPSAPSVVLWFEDSPVYGSEAYQLSGAEAEFAEYERANDGPIYGLRGTATPGYRGWA